MGFFFFFFFFFSGVFFFYFVHVFNSQNPPRAKVGTKYLNKVP